MDSTGLVTSLSGTAEGAPAARALYGVDGTGLTVGIVSDSFNLTAPVTAFAPSGDTQAFDIASGDLPAATTVLGEGTAGSGNTDEGRGLAQLIHDVAPGAAIDFCTSGNTQAQFASAILTLAKAGCKVIVDDIGFPDEPAYQDGVVAQAIDQAVQTYGVTYFSAAGNDGTSGWQGAARFETSAASLFYGVNRPLKPPVGATLHLEQFASGTGAEDYLTLADAATGALSSVQVTLQFNQPLGAVTATVELLVEDATTGYLLPAADQGIDSTVSTGQAIQFVDFQPVAGHTYRLLAALVSKGQGAAPTDLKIVASSSDPITLGDAATNAASENTGTLAGHPAAADAIAVGAADYLQTPAFGSPSPVVETYSSAGPDVVQFDTNGVPLPQPQLRTVALTAADGGATTFFGDSGANGSFAFFGTSAASADAAGIGALILQADPKLIWSQVEALMQLTAIPTADPAQGGAGLVQAEQSVRIAEVLRQTSDALVTGTSGVDALTGSPGGDVLLGGAGNDTIHGGPGNDFIDGGAGTDVAVFASAVGANAVVRAADGTVFVSGPEGGDTLVNVEVLQFTDGAIYTAGIGTVATLYEALVARAPSSGELAYWTSALNAGTATADGLGRVLANTADGQAHLPELVSSFYELDLGRAASSGEVGYWSGALQNGSADLGALEAALAGQPGAGAQAALTVDLLYRTFLGRDPAAAESAYWTGVIGSGTTDLSRAERLFAGFDAGGTHEAAAVKGAYDTLIGRDPSAGEVSYWSGQLGGGAVGTGDLGAILLGTATGQAHTGATIQALYQGDLGRAASGDEVGYWQGRLAAGAIDDNGLNDLLQTVSGAPFVHPLAGTAGADSFSFTSTGGHLVISGFDPSMDVVHLQGAALASFDPLAHAVQTTTGDGYADVLVSFDPADTILFKHLALSALHASDFIHG